MFLWCLQLFCYSLNSVLFRYSSRRCRSIDEVSTTNSMKFEFSPYLRGYIYYSSICDSLDGVNSRMKRKRRRGQPRHWMCKTFRGVIDNVETFSTFFLQLMVRFRKMFGAVFSFFIIYYVRVCWGSRLWRYFEMIFTPRSQTSCTRKSGPLVAFKGIIGRKT